MRRVVGAVCIGHKSGSTNFLLQATANKVSRRALLNHHFVVPLLRWRMLLRILCVRKTSTCEDFAIPMFVGDDVLDVPF